MAARILGPTRPSLCPEAFPSGAGRCGLVLVFSSRCVRGLRLCHCRVCGQPGGSRLGARGAFRPGICGLGRQLCRGLLADSAQQQPERGPSARLSVLHLPHPAFYPGYGPAERPWPAADRGNPAAGGNPVCRHHWCALLLEKRSRRLLFPGAAMVVGFGRFQPPSLPFAGTVLSLLLARAVFAGRRRCRRNMPNRPLPRCTGGFIAAAVLTARGHYRWGRPAPHASRRIAARAAVRSAASAARRHLVHLLLCADDVPVLRRSLWL